MKIAIVSLMAAASFQALSATVALGPLPPTGYADSESSTNMPFSAGIPGSRILSFQIDFSATPSNNVEIAIGHDANGDGVLSLDETGMVVGWDCGEWIARDGRFEACLRADAATGNARKSFVWTLHETDGLARTVTVTENGHEVNLGVCGRAAAWMFDLSWDTVRFIARGRDVADENIVAQFHANSTAIRLR